MKLRGQEGEGGNRVHGYVANRTRPDVPVGSIDCQRCVLLLAALGTCRLFGGRVMSPDGRKPEAVVPGFFRSRVCSLVAMLRAFVGCIRPSDFSHWLLMECRNSLNPRRIWTQGRVYANEAIDRDAPTQPN